ncbi:MAG TPA: PmoA family protein [Phycisphaerae bacterium]|nr:PmoA family protein [Phycisphaerales bacterium]HRX84967.1 PmoA family protein [Phycisphaerae bacterium]
MRISVQAPEDGRPAAPVAARIPLERLEDEHVIGLVDADSGRPVPVQVDSRGRFCWLQDAMQPGERREYRLQSRGFLADVPRVVVCERAEGDADILEGANRIAAYRSTTHAHRPFLSPITSPAGVGVTVDGVTVDGAASSAGIDPCDHHHSCWNGWADVNGVDHWTDGARAGRQRHRRFTLSASGPVFGRLSALIDWLDTEGNPQFTEQRVYLVYAAIGGSRIIDITSRMIMAYGDVRFGDTSDGGLCAVRVAPALSRRGGGMLRNANGEQGEEDCRGSSATWCDCTGQIDDRFVGVTMFDCPSNLRYPTLWNVRDDGLMAANPFGVSSFCGEGEGDGGGARTFAWSEVAMFRYRLLIHDSAPSPEDLDRLADCFSRSLEIEID